MIKEWGYLKRFPEMSIGIDNQDPILNDVIEHQIPNVKDQYKCATEDIDRQFPESIGKELDISILFDSDHAHDKVTGRSI